MAILDFYSIYQRCIYIILHYCSLWTILTCIIAAGISWRLCTFFSSQDSCPNDAHLAWWTTVVWGGAAVIFLLIGFLLT